MRRSSGHERHGFLLQRGSVRGERVLPCGERLHGFGFGHGPGGLPGRGELRGLLLLVDRHELLQHLFDLGQVFLRLLQFGDVLGELLVGTLQGVEGGLLRGRVVLFLRQRVLRLLHLARRFADGLRGFGGGTGRLGLTCDTRPGCSQSCAVPSSCMTSGG